MMSTTGATSAKRKEAPNQSDDAAAAAENRRITLSPNQNKEISPYKARHEEFSQIRQQRSSSTGEEYVIALLSSPLRKLTEERLAEVLGNNNDDLEELDGQQREAALDKLTQKEVDDFCRVMIVPGKLFDLNETLSQSILYADSRNSPGDGFVMLNTHSTWCMYPVISKMLTKATKELNAAIKRAGSPNVAVNAFCLVTATIMAINEVDHWRCDYEDPDENEKLTKRVLKLVKDLLWLDDSELGIIDTDPYTRQGLLHLLCNIANDWLGGASKLKVAKNGFGMGRSHAPAPPAAKKQKVTQAVAVATTTTTSTSSSNNTTPTIKADLMGYINFLSPDKLKNRVKTVLQLKITDLIKPERTVLCLVSGAMHAKKLNQLVAYLSGTTNDFRYHSQKGANLKGSRIELTAAPDKKMWLAEKSAAKQAAAAGCKLAVDKDVKVVQLFQGLTMGPEMGISWDSTEAKAFGIASGSVVWVSPEDKRYEIAVQAIVPNKCRVENEPLPRVVTHEDLYENDKVKTGFGKMIKTVNKFLRDGRQGHGLLMFGNRTAAEEQRILDRRDATPLCDNEGKSCQSGKYSFLWKEENVNSASPPDLPVR